MGVQAQVASATGMYMVYFTCFASTVAVLLMNKLPIQYAIILCILTAMGTYPGVYGQAYIVKKTGK